MFGNFAGKKVCNVILANNKNKKNNDPMEFENDIFVLKSNRNGQKIIYKGHVYLHSYSGKFNIVFRCYLAHAQEH